MIVSLCVHAVHGRVGATASDVADTVLFAAEGAFLVCAHATPEGCLVVPQCAMAVHVADTPGSKGDGGGVCVLHADGSVRKLLDGLPGPVVDAVFVAVSHPMFVVHVRVKILVKIDEALYSLCAIVERTTTMRPIVRSVRWLAGYGTCDVDLRRSVRRCLGDAINDLISSNAIVRFDFAKVDFLLGPNRRVVENVLHGGDDMADHFSVLVVPQVHGGEQSLLDLTQDCGAVRGYHELPLVESSPNAGCLCPVDLVGGPLSSGVDMDLLCAWGGGGYPDPCSDVVSLASSRENLCDATAVRIGELLPLISEGAAVTPVVSDDICPRCGWVRELRCGDLCLRGGLAEFVSGWWG